jgi:hypothetical protein
VVTLVLIFELDLKLAFGLAAAPLDLTTSIVTGLDAAASVIARLHLATATALGLSRDLPGRLGGGGKSDHVDASSEGRRGHRSDQNLPSNLQCPHLRLDGSCLSDPTLERAKQGTDHGDVRWEYRLG